MAAIYLVDYVESSKSGPTHSALKWPKSMFFGGKLSLYCSALVPLDAWFEGKKFKIPSFWLDYDFYKLHFLLKFSILWQQRQVVRNEREFGIH